MSFFKWTLGIGVKAPAGVHVVCVKKEDKRRVLGRTDR